MLQPQTIQFLKNLKKNNSKEWFDANKKSYEIAKQNFLELTANVLESLKKIDTTLQHLEPKKCIFRINRDVRFSKDKSPYKTNFGMSFSKDGKSSIAAGYYFHLEPDGCFIGGGLYAPMSSELNKVRQEIDYNFSDFKKIISNKKFIADYHSLNFSKEFTLVRPPKGYDESNEAIQFIKLKSFVTMASISNDELLDKSFSKNIVTHFATIKPLVDFLNNALQ